MGFPTRRARGDGPLITPLILSDRLLQMAKDADRAGYRTSARRLVRLAHSVLDDDPMVSDSWTARICGGRGKDRSSDPYRVKVVLP